MIITIETIPHSCQRYETCGDWIWTIRDTGEHELQINISDTGSEDSNFLIALHEFVEAYLCKRHDISGEQVDQWDIDHIVDPNPGSLPGCLYRYEHLAAEHLEKSMACHLRVDWQEHERLINLLFKEEQ